MKVNTQEPASHKFEEPLVWTRQDLMADLRGVNNREVPDLARNLTDILL
jgi:hypothetical protein